MTTILPYENLDFIQNGEPVSGGTGGNSDGVLNRPLVELHANVDKVRDEHDLLSAEVTTARGGELNLDARLDGIDQEIVDLQNQSTYEDASQAEIVAEQIRDRVPSTFDFASYNELAEVTFDPTTARNNTQAWTLAIQPLANKTSSFANHVAFIGNPKNLYIDGYKIHLDARPAYLASALINLGAAPSTGSRLDFAFIEVWKEKVVLGAADDVLFPNGAVFFEGTGTFNGCTLYTANASGGNNPAYLAASANHGAYIKANDVNIAQFLANPNNNVVKNGTEYYQIRWRIRVHNGVSSYLLSQASGDANVKAQGMLAAPSAVAFSTVDGDAGLSRASHSSLALDGYVRAVSVAIIHRRNTTAWSLSNPNGAGSLSGTSGRPDVKFYDHIHFNDVCDLRHHGMMDNAYDYKAIYERNLDKILSCQLMTTFEPLMSDSDGNLTYKDLNIYGTKLLRMDGLIGTVPMDAGWEVITRLTAENGVTCKFDGIRNYFSDVGGDQAVTGMIPAMDADGVNPTTCFSYVAATKTLTFDTSDFDSGLDNNADHASRTKVSTRQPHVRWGVSGSNMLAAARSAISGLDSVAGTWTGLGGDSASFAVDTVTYFRACSEKVTAGTRVYAGDVYEAVNGVQMTLTHDSGYDSGGYAYVYLFGTFSGPTAPEVGTWTKISGSGVATIASTIGSGTNVHPVFYNTTSDLSSMIRNAVYTDGVKQYSVSRVFPATQIVCLNSYPNIVDNYFTAPRNVSLTKVSGTGPDTLAITTGYRLDGLGIKRNDSSYTSAAGETVGLGSNVMPANAPIHINAYATFAPGSGFLSRIPHNDNNSFVGCHFNVNGTQVLPNNGVGFIPFGSTVDPVNDGNLPVDSHSRTSNLMGFLYKGAVMNIGTAPNGYNSLHSVAPSVIKDGSTYKMWFSGSTGTNYRILHSTSTDGTTWSTPVLAMNIGTEPNGYNSVHSSNPSVIKDGTTYKMWFSGSTSTNYRTLYSTSADGTTWSTPVLAMNIGTEPNGYNSSHSFFPSVIKDGSTYKMWFSGSTGTNYRILHSTSTDGTTWSTPVLAMNIGTEPNGYNSVHSSNPSVIKDGTTYKMWFSGSTGTNHRILHAVLTMTDVNNTGSSLTGVYSTTGSLNHAPPANSQVVVMYEALADQMDRSLIGKAPKITAFPILAPETIVTSLGTGVSGAAPTNYGSFSGNKNRDLLSDIQPINYFRFVGAAVYEGSRFNGFFNSQLLGSAYPSSSTFETLIRAKNEIGSALLPINFPANELQAYSPTDMLGITLPTFLDYEAYASAGVSRRIDYSDLGRRINRGVCGITDNNYLVGLRMDVIGLNNLLSLNCVSGAVGYGFINTTLITPRVPLGRPILK